MLRLVRYLKPYVTQILVTIGLLFVLANTDLALPDYLSRIVNVGIQQQGVENAVAQAIRQTEMEKLLLFMTGDEQTVVRDAYALIEPGSPEATAYVQQVPALETEAIYVRRDLTGAETAALNPILGKAFVAVSSIEGMTADPARAQAMAQNLGIDLSRLPPGADPFALLASLPPAQQSTLTAAILKQVGNLGDSMVNQIAAGAVVAETRALGVDTAELQTTYILRTGSLMLLIALLGGLCAIAAGYLAARTAAGAARDIRLASFQRVESFSSAEFDKFSTASLITRSTNDISQIQLVIYMIIRMVFYAPILGIGAVIRATDKGANMWWILAAAVVMLLSLILVVFSISLPKFKIMQSLIDRLNLVTRENLSGMMVIRAFSKEKDEEKRFDAANRNLTDTSLFVARVMVTMMPVIMLIMNLLSVTIIWVGAQQVAAANIQVGDMIAFLQYAMLILFAFLMTSMIFIFLPRAAVAGGRIADVLETETSINDPDQPKAFQTPFVPRIEFRDVSFRYPGATDNVLCNISFTARPGETTALIGSTGCGKSTVVNLIPRFYDVTEGAILVDGIDLRDVTQQELRDKIGYVPQTGTLFSGTIESNLRYADDDAGEPAIREAAEIAQAMEFISAKPEGFDAPIAQGGGNVSGGQKQRLAIARALVKRPPIYIFDDSFSALDFKTDSALRRALKEKTGDSTVLIVTQRVATVKNADQILVLEEGEVVGQGSHHDLMKTCNAYREIAQSQLSPEELA